MLRGRVKHGLIFIFGWTNPLYITAQCVSAQALGHKVCKLLHNTRTSWWACPEVMDEWSRQTSESQMKPLRPLSGSHIAGPQTATELNFSHMRKLCDGSNSSLLTEPLITPNQLLVVNGPEWTVSSEASRPTGWYHTHWGKQISHSALVLQLIPRPSASLWTGNGDGVLWTP